MFLDNFRRAGVLGINSRNLRYIMKFNRRRYYPLADSKITSKTLAEKAGIPVPEQYGIIDSVGETGRVVGELQSKSSFVIKPEHGSGGDGVLVVATNHGDRFETSSGRVLNFSDLRMHVANILYGLFSLGGQMDRALVEAKVNFARIFENIAFRGVPDIRVIVFQGVPVMAMLRLPTQQSQGRANLHQGAIGVGIELSSGRTRGGVSGSQLMANHPDTGHSIVDFPIPYWDEILKISCRSYELFHLGYLGVDIVLDEQRGPLVLEVNVRPGLAIQLANRRGLSRRLALVSENVSNLDTVEKKINFCKERVCNL